MKVLLTGASGFIGRHVLARLVARGDAVRTLARRLPGASPAAGTAFVQGDLLDPAALARAAEGCDAAVHLAAMVSFRREDEEALLRVNAEGTRSLLEASRRAGVRCAVVASSACTIGLSTDPSRVLDEEAPLDERLLAHNVYLRSKVLAERHAMEAVGGGLHVSIVNPTTAYGPGDERLNSGTLVLSVARKRCLPVPPGGSNVVDVEDVADGILAALDRGRPARRYILGGENLRFGEIFRTVARVTGRSPLLVPLPRLARLPMRAAAFLVSAATGSRLLTPQIVEDTFAYKYYSSARAERELGWRARRPFAESVGRAWGEYQARGLA